MQAGIGTDEPPDPRNVGLLRANAVMPHPTTLPHTLKQPGNAPRIVRKPLLAMPWRGLVHATSHYRRLAKQDAAGSAPGS